MQSHMFFRGVFSFDELVTFVTLGKTYGIASSILSIGIIFNPSVTLAAISFKSISLSLGIRTVSMPYLLAAISFSFKPPIGSTFPLSVISPVMAILFEAGLPEIAEYRAIAIVIPAEGPSLGIA